MKRKITLLALIALLAKAEVRAQLNVGGTGAPGSTLSVNGSFSAMYKQVTASYTMTGTDYYVVYNGAAAGTITLPAAGTGTMKGRVYTIKNTTAAQTLTITPNGSETIDGSTSITVAPGSSAQIVSTGLTSGATWEIVSFNAATAAAPGTLYTADGALTGNRSVNLNSKVLNFGGTNGSSTILPTGDLQTLDAYGKSIKMDLSSNSAHTDPVLQFKPYGTGNPARLTTSGSPLAIVTQGTQSTDANATAYSMFINNTGNVGIGTGTPNHLLDLGTANGGSSLTDPIGKKLALFDNASATDFYGLGISSGYLQFHASSTANKAPGMVLTSGGNVGIGTGTTAPGSTLQIAGSLAPMYNQITTTPYTMAATDFYVVYNGTAAGTVNLPAAGTGTMKGRLYTIKNTTAAQTLTVAANGAETIDGTASFSIAPGNSIQLVSTGTTSGATWEVVNFAATTTSTGTTLYTGDGTLSGNRTVTQGANSLSFNYSGTGIGMRLNPATGSIGFSQSALGRFNIDASGISGGRFTALENGNVGIGNATPHAPLQFSNSTQNRKIVLWENADNDHQFYGLGINGSTFRYQTDGTASDHVFFAAASATASNELMRIKGNGNVGIGTSTPNSTLQVNGSMSGAVNYYTVTQTGLALDGTMRHLIFNTGGNNTINLPNPATCIGREYIIDNMMTGDQPWHVDVTLAGGGTIKTKINNYNLAILYILPGQTRTLIATSMGWLLTDNDIPLYFTNGGSQLSINISTATNVFFGGSLHFKGVWYSACAGLNNPVDFVISSGVFVQNGLNANNNATPVSVAGTTYNLSADRKVLIIGNGCGGTQTWTISGTGASAVVTISGTISNTTGVIRAL